MSTRVRSGHSKHSFVVSKSVQRRARKLAFPDTRVRIAMILSPILSFPKDADWTIRACELGKIGCIRIVQHRPLDGIPKSCTVTRTATGKWFATISCDIGGESDAGSAVGIDVGLNSFAVTSDGQKIANQRFFRKEQKSLAKAQRKWDAVKKRPKTDAVREKRRKIIARVHERIRNKRHNFAHQASRKMVNRHSFIAVEKLKVKKMQKNRRLSKSIAT